MSAKTYTFSPGLHPVGGIYLKDASIASVVIEVLAARRLPRSDLVTHGQAHAVHILDWDGYVGYVSRMWVQANRKHNDNTCTNMYKHAHKTNCLDM